MDKTPVKELEVLETLAPGQPDGEVPGTGKPATGE